MALQQLRARLAQQRSRPVALPAAGANDHNPTTNSLTTASATIPQPERTLTVAVDKEAEPLRQPPDAEGEPRAKRSAVEASYGDDELEELLNSASHREMQTREQSSAITTLLLTPSVKEQATAARLQSRRRRFREFCQYTTAEECMAARKSANRCGLMHYVPIIKPFTDVSLGDCTYLNECRLPAHCRFAHYGLDLVDKARMDKEMQLADAVIMPQSAVRTMLDGTDLRTYPGQWIQCDVRHLDMSVLGKFSVIMADPPWQIRMDLPYGTMSDHEMRKLQLGQLQDDGYIFLWVTGRAMELSRELLQLWGYRRVDELVWIKTNQLQNLIRSGRTGHWLNHAKEHCIIGVKCRPRQMNRGLDCDVLVAEMRTTSHKPDEIYGIIERLSPGTRKLEIFGRQHNVQPNWVTLGNQLDGVRLVDPDMIERFKARYPYSPKETQMKLLTGELRRDLKPRHPP